MGKLPALRGRDIQRTLEKAGFKTVRQRGSHIRMKHQDGRVVTIPIHAGRDIGRGLLRKILRDAELSRDHFFDLLSG